MNRAADSMMDTTTDSARSIWQRSHYLNRMTLRDLVQAYFQHHTIVVYLLLSALFIGIAAFYPPTLAQGIAAVVAASIIYPVAWYFIHKYILHGRWLFKSQLTAKMWKRIHYDHHIDPNHLEVLFGSLGTTLPTVAVATAIAGYAIGGVGGASIAFATGLLTTCLYEFVHCIQHLGFKPKAKWLQEMKRRHMEHHFHDEDGNYGIVTFLPDRLLGTYYERMERKERSPHVFNLGYTPEMAERYPWVARLSGGVAMGHPRQRAQADG